MMQRPVLNRRKKGYCFFLQVSSIRISEININSQRNTSGESGSINVACNNGGIKELLYRMAAIQPVLAR
jgi:hypothetical protein